MTVKEVVQSLEEAQAEADHLSALNARKGCRYYWQMTRRFSDGGFFGGEGEVTAG